jgi:hypothetical protein
MKVAVIGGRDFDNYSLVFNKLDKLNKLNKITHIVSGGAKGADAIGKAYALRNNIIYIEHEAKWNDLSHPDALIREKYGKKYDANAGFRRNKYIINDADIIIAFWNNKSLGTKDSITYAKSINKPIKIFYY